jgi:lipopolysaccharide transport system permease protein
MVISDTLKSDLTAVYFIARVSLYKRYCGSLVGMGWSLLNPMIQLLVYFFAFGMIMKVPIENYFVYLAAGLLPWSFISNSAIMCSTSIVSRKDTFQSTAMPHWIFVLADISCELFGMMIALSLLLAVAILNSDNALLVIVMALPILLPIIVVAYSVGVISAYMGALYRDLPHLFNLFFSVMFWLTPIIYHWTMVPKEIEVIAKYNPFAMLIGSLQVLLHGGILPSPDLLMATYAIAGLSALAAISVIRRMGNAIVYAL